MSENYVSTFIMVLQYISPINDIFCGSTALILNSLLILLVIFKTAKEMKFYRRVLVLNIVIDINHALSVLVTQTVGVYWGNEKVFCFSKSISVIALL